MIVYMVEMVVNGNGGDGSQWEWWSKEMGAVGGVYVSCLWRPLCFGCLSYKLHCTAVNCAALHFLFLFHSTMVCHTSFTEWQYALHCRLHTGSYGVHCNLHNCTTYTILCTVFAPGPTWCTVHCADYTLVFMGHMC